MSDLDLTDGSIPKSFTKAITDRLSHPVAGLFIVAWILFNWEMLFFLTVADSPADERITVAMNYTDWEVGLIWPAIVTVVYIVTSPWLQVVVSRWNGWVADKQSLRAYHDSLVQLQRQSELEQRAMQSMQPALSSQQAQKVRLEREIENLVQRKTEIEIGFRNLMELADPKWKFDGNMAYSELAEKFKSVESLKKQLGAKHSHLLSHFNKAG